MAKTAIKPTPEEKKIKAGKKASKHADKKRGKIKIGQEAKKLADKAILTMAAEMPAGHGNALIRDHAEHNKAEEAVAAAQKWKRDVRARMKGYKVDMSCYDRVNKLSKMEPGDVAAKKATEALYENQIGMALSDEQKKIVDNINVQRENARAAMADLSAGESGKEVGSGMIGHNSDNGESNGEEGVPERNERVGAGFRVPETESAAKH